MLNDFLVKWAESSKTQLLTSTKDLVGMMRQRGHPIIWVRQEFEPDLRDAFPEMLSKGIKITIKGTAGSGYPGSSPGLPANFFNGLTRVFSQTCKYWKHFFLTRDFSKLS